MRLQKTAVYVFLLYFCRFISSNGKQEVPCIGGFISSTGAVPPKKTTLDYYQPIHQPITKDETVAELLKRSEEATDEVGQPYVFNTFDLGVCMKALPLIWKFPEKYRKHIVIPGPFHTKMNYIGMLTKKKAAGSGYKEILLEAGLVTSGCLKSVISGKAFSKALFNLKATIEALERLLFEVFTEETNIEIRPDALLNVIRRLTRQELDIALQDESTANLIQTYQEFQSKVRCGYLGKTGIFWISFMDDAKLVFLLTFAVKTNNRRLFHKINGMMADLFFAFDGQNYSR